MRLFKEFLISECSQMVEGNVRVKTIGVPSRFPKDVVEALDNLKKATAHCNGIDVVMALNYGARDELCRAMQKIVDSHQGGIKITESLISDHLDTAAFGDPDLFIRTSGEMRISNFLLWQLSYAEFYVADVFWPEFTPYKFLEAVVDFQKRKRRLGGT